MDLNVFDMLLEPVFALNDQGAVIYLNPSANHLLGVSNKKTFDAKHFSDLIAFEKEIPELKELHKLSAPVSYRELKFTTQNKRNGMAQIALTPYKEGGKTQWILYFRDVTLEQNLHEKFKLELKQKEIYTEVIEQAHQDLAHYSENLENMVDQRTAELQKVNKTMHALLDSLDQGFFIFDSKGICSNIYSKSCVALLGTNPDGYSFVDIVRLDRSEHDAVQSWIKSLFSAPKDFRELSALGPKKIQNTKDQLFSLSYYPMYDGPQRLENVAVVVTDNTELDKAEMEAERERAYSLMVINVVRRKREIIKFIFDTQKLITELETSIVNHYKFNIQLALRSLHTIKGGATTFAIYDLAVSCHLTEKFLVNIQSEGLAKDSLQILQTHFSKIKYEFQAFLKGNQVLLGNEVIHGKRTIEIPMETLSDFLSGLKTDQRMIEKVTLFEKNIFYVPIKQFFEGFEETTQALANKLGKKLHPIIIEGGDTLIHREQYSEVFSTLIHQLNNIVDHGIEDPVLRRFHHKEEYGQITIKTSVQPTTLWPNGHALVIEISDNGKGLDAKKIREQVEKKGILTEHLSDEEVLQYIFKSDITTTNNLTQISGRGIGMEAIMFAVMDLKGQVRITSSPMKGSTLTLTLPYSVEPIQISAAS